MIFIIFFSYNFLECLVFYVWLPVLVHPNLVSTHALIFTSLKPFLVILLFFFLFLFYFKFNDTLQLVEYCISLVSRHENIRVRFHWGIKSKMYIFKTSTSRLFKRMKCFSLGWINNTSYTEKQKTKIADYYELIQNVNESMTLLTGCDCFNNKLLFFFGIKPKLKWKWKIIFILDKRKMFVAIEADTPL